MFRKREGTFRQRSDVFHAVVNRLPINLPEASALNISAEQLMKTHPLADIRRHCCADKRAKKFSLHG